MVKSEVGYLLSSLANWMEGNLIQGDGEIRIDKLVIDSRSYKSGSGRLFFALTGERHNAHRYIPDLYEKGLRAFVISESDFPVHHFPDSHFVLVNDSLKALQITAKRHREEFDYPVVGITGSNGKTIVKEWLWQVLSPDRKIIRSPKSYNSKVGVPLSLWLMRDDDDMALIEAGISRPGEMDSLAEMVRPTLGIFTNIGPPHQENFPDLDSKIAEKLKLFRGVDVLFYCRDHHRIHEQVKASGINSKTWGRNTDTDLQIKSLEVRTVESRIRGEFEGKDREITIPFIDAASIENACHCWLVMLYLGLPNSTISDRISALSPVTMRMEQVAGIRNSSILNDAYSNDLASLEIALNQLKSQTHQGRYTAILSDILQSGQSAEELYGRVSRLIQEKEIDRLIGVGPEIMSQRHLFGKGNHAFFESTSAFLKVIDEFDFRNENILVKGARNFEFERIVERLQEKTHETVLEIDLDRMRENLNYIRSLLKPNTRIMVMVKAFAYGSGSYEIAQMLEYNRVDYLAVAYADEGIALREAGIKLPILVLNPEVSTYDAMIRFCLEPQLFSFRTLEKFESALSQSNNQDYPVHLKIDTGMHRLGFNLEEMPELAKRLKSNDRIRVKSVFSHLAGSDSVEFDDLTERQIEVYEKAVALLQDELNTSFWKHILNSNGILRHTQAQYDMVRLGLGLYGLSSNPRFRSELQPVSRLVTTISQIRTVPEGEGVGYSPKFKLEKPTRIGVIPVGYADGLPRLLGNGRWSVLIGNKKAPIIGNVCMDMTMINLDGIECSEGDEVEVFGDTNSIYDYADALGTIPYEVLTNVSQRVRRVFRKD